MSQITDARRAGAPGSQVPFIVYTTESVVLVVGSICAGHTSYTKNTAITPLVITLPQPPALVQKLEKTAEMNFKLHVKEY